MLLFYKHSLLDVLAFMNWELMIVIYQEIKEKN